MIYNDYSDQQVGIQRIDPSGQTLSAITNAGVVEIKGFELEATWRAAERVTLASGLQWFAEAAGTYRSERYMDEANLSTLAAYTLLDLRAGISGDCWSATLFVNNATDDDSIRSAQRFVDVGRPEGGFAPGRAAIAYLPTPRVYGLRADFKF